MSRSGGRAIQSHLTVPRAQSGAYWRGLLVEVFGANTPLGGVLIFGGIFVPVTAAFVTVVVLWADAGDEVVLRGDGRTWGESGHHSGGTYYPGFLDDGGGVDGGSGVDGGGGGW